MVATFTGEQIREKINQNNLTMQNLFNPSQFTLSEDMARLLEENANLRLQCPHHYVNGVCEYCGSMEVNS